MSASEFCWCGGVWPCGFPERHTRVVSAPHPNGPEGTPEPLLLRSDVEDALRKADWPEVEDSGEEGYARAASYAHTALDEVRRKLGIS